MKKLIAGIGAALISSSLPVAAAENDGWAVIGRDRATDTPVMWIKAKNAEQLNDDSVKVRYRDSRGEFEMRLNCKNKDFQLSGFGGWDQIGENSGFWGAGVILCRHLPARTAWGFTDDTSHLWNAPIPKGDPGDAEGEWIEFQKDEKAEVFINDEVQTDGKIAIYSIYVLERQTDQGTGTKKDRAQYWWMIADCNRNKYATLIPLNDGYIGANWNPPSSPRPNGTVNYVRKNYCSKPNTTFATLPLPTIESMRRYAD